MRQVNTVAIGPLPSGSEFFSVSVDHTEAARQALKHAFRAGYDNPGLMLRADHSQETRRRWESGYDIAYREKTRGVPRPPSLTFDARAPDAFAS